MSMPGGSAGYKVRRRFRSACGASSSPNTATMGTPSPTPAVAVFRGLPLRFGAPAAASSAAPGAAPPSGTTATAAPRLLPGPRRTPRRGFANSGMRSAMTPLPVFGTWQSGAAAGWALAAPHCAHAHLAIGGRHEAWYPSARAPRSKQLLEYITYTPVAHLVADRPLRLQKRGPTTWLLIRGCLVSP